MPLLLPSARLLEEAGHLAEHGDVVGIEREDLLVVRLRVIRAPEILRVPLGEPEAQGDLLERLRLLLEPAVDGGDQLGPPVRRLREATIPALEREAKRRAKAPGSGEGGSPGRSSGRIGSNSIVSSLV